MAFRIVPSEKAGYGPGEFVLQHYDRAIGVWFDVGDPKPTREAAVTAAEVGEDTERVLLAAVNRAIGP